MEIKNFILLAAGRGSRLSQLTNRTHKSLLPVAGKPAIQYLLDQLTCLKNIDIVVVTGYLCDDINSFIQSNYGDTVRTVHNKYYESDINILSVDLGANSLLSPEKGYMIIETDIILEPAGWQHLFSPRNSTISEWATIGKYSAELTGAALLADKNENVVDIVYAPEHDVRFDGWSKLLGTLYVGENEVTSYTTFRKEAIKESIAQYYLMPWINNIDKLSSRNLDLSKYYAASFNDIETYKRIDNEYSLLINNQGELLNG